MLNVRQGGVTLKGRPLDVSGEMLQVGDTAPNFSLAYKKFSVDMVSLSDYEGKVRILSVVPSLDTGLCDLQTRRFNEALASVDEGVVLMTISADTPFAQVRWCGTAGLENALMLSDYMDMSFSNAYGLHLVDFRVAQRAVFVIDAEGKIAYAEYVPEIAQHPDYEAALAVVAELTAQ